LGHINVKPLIEWCEFVGNRFQYFLCSNSSNNWSLLKKEKSWLQLKFNTNSSIPMGVTECQPTRTTCSMHRFSRSPSKKKKLEKIHSRNLRQQEKVITSLPNWAETFFASSNIKCFIGCHSWEKKKLISVRTFSPGPGILPVDARKLAKARKPM
jgi:hypothetical protein